MVMARKLTPRTSLENLKREAKRWLNALRNDDADARARFARAHPTAPAQPVLRHVQHALAREHGFSGWAALKQQLEGEARDTPGYAHQVELFLKNACPDHRVYGSSHDSARHTAERVIRRHPEIARDSIYTAVACGDIEHVERILTERPDTASEPGGPRSWPPLLYLCSVRLPWTAATTTAVDIARALLDRGADPNAHYFAGTNNGIRYSALTCLAGEGEGDAPPHAQRDALTDLLLERDAEPYDIQVLYNTHFHGNILWWMELIYAHSVRQGRQADWNDPEWHMLDMGGYGCGAHYLLSVAIAKNDLTLAQWILDHGATPNAPPPRGGPTYHPPQHSLYTEALRRGLPEMAELLTRYGATPTPFVPGARETFGAACFRLDRAAAAAQLTEHPEFLSESATIFAAARRDRDDVVAFLLDLGAPIEVQDGAETRPLHVAAGHNALRVAALLIDRGAEIDAIERSWNNTALDFAVYERHPRMIELLSRVSRDVWNLTYTGNVERLRELLTKEPALARATKDSGETPLMWLPDDEARAVEIIELFLANGADPSVRDKNGRTAVDYALDRALDDAAAVLRAAR